MDEATCNKYIFRYKSDTTGSQGAVAEGEVRKNTWRIHR